MTTADVIDGPPQVLRIIAPGPNPDGKRVYSRFDTLNSTDTAIFEINCKVILSGDSNGVGFGFVDTTTNPLSVGKSLGVGLFAAGSIFVFAAGSTVSFNFNTTDKFHTYRIVKNGEVNMEVWADGNKVKVLDIDYKDLEPRPTVFTESHQYFENSGSEECKWDIAYVSYSIFSS